MHWVHNSEKGVFENFVSYYTFYEKHARKWYHATPDARIY